MPIRGPKQEYFCPPPPQLDSRRKEENPDLTFSLTKTCRPCVDCHAFEFMQRALQDLKKTAYNLDTRVGVTLEMMLRFNVPTHPD
uniref:NELL2-interacting cell ontogeny regulator 1 n=1 Tax=Gopherus evgoodei TaxID=1825980 RepID=A0A8C4VK75_9SAUR